MQATHLKALPAVLLILIIGSAAALWSDSLKVKSVVETGEVDVELRGNLSATDFEHMLPDPKDVGECFATFSEIEDEDAGNPSGNNDLDLNITVVNAYPSYTCKVDQVFVENTGTIPVKIIEVELVLPPNASCDFNPVTNQFDCDMDGDGDYDVNIWGSFQTLNATKPQLHPGDRQFFTVEMHVKQGAPENSLIWFQIKIKAAQWNEA